MNEYNNILFSKEKDFYLLKINRPKQLNALNQETISELKKCFEYIKKNISGYYGVIITGEGEKSFVAGADIKEFGSLHMIWPWAGSDGLIWSIPTGGYIVGFIVASYVIGRLAEKGWDRKPRIIAAMLLVNIVIYVFGLPWLMFDLQASLSNTLLCGLWPFIPGDALKLVLASMVLPGARSLVSKMAEKTKRPDGRGYEDPFMETMVLPSTEFLSDLHVCYNLDKCCYVVCLGARSIPF